MVRNFTKFTYPSITRDESTGKRLYKIPNGKLVPSVTTVLDKTKDKTKLDEWRQRIGNKEADLIMEAARDRGTRMHSYLEAYVAEIPNKLIDNTEVDLLASEMASVVINKGLKYLDEAWMTEVPLFYKDQYAGTTDLVGLYKGKACIVDFKQTNKPKKTEWILDYYLQLCAYAHAHNFQHGTMIENGVILMCSKDLDFQMFEVNEIQFAKYSYMWFNRVKEYNKLVCV